MSSTVTAVQILERLLAHESLKDNLQFVHIQRFFELGRRIWLEIVPPDKSRPLLLPSNIAEENIVQGRLYTLRRGFHINLGCHTRYYPNYSVRDASHENSKRQYYSTEVPTLIHVTETSYMEPDLCKYFAFQLALSHATCQGIAQVYNRALGASDLPNRSRLSHELTGDLVFDSFLLHALLQDKRNRREILSLPHRGYQNHRYDEALAQRNLRMVGTGQDMWAHACNRCMKLYQGEDNNWYRLTAGVHDGVAVRHLCCSVHNCTEALQSQRDYFCYSHRHLLKICCIQGCNATAEPGFRTCTIESHRAFQTDAERKNTAMFQLHSRLRQAGISQIRLAGSSTAVQPVPLLETASASTGSTGRVKGKLTRSWTHNEQLFVRCCGVIISRATFFGSEGITGVKTFLKVTFPTEYPGSLPSYIFYDNNCGFLKHLRAAGDHYFDKVGLPVDHSEGDVFCQTHCNPARFRELQDEEGKWIFNSSAAEQANVWFGKFQNVVQDMPVLKCVHFIST
ncbi:hypothetical protein B0H19DRAFT_1290213 [Mycena capillaripes]|nr:hypothetical protein B0H19DRAFT_1290213 [Mycena capillaripes]